MKLHRTPPLGLIVVSALAGALASSVQAAPDTKTIERGKYLVETGGCHDCHTPFKLGPKGPKPDLARALSGHPESLKAAPPPKLDANWVMAGNATNTAYAGPWGISFAANITSDKDTGLGNWTIADFVKTMKTGKHLGVGRPIMPPMPWQAYGRIVEADLAAMFAYLQSTPAVKNRVPDYQPPLGAAK